MKRFYIVLFTILLLISFMPLSLQINSLNSNFLALSIFQNELNLNNKNFDLKNKKDSRSKIRLPIVMYHKISADKKGTYMVNQMQLENDLIAFKNQGYTSVFPSEIIRYVKHGGRLPEKPLLITFDDGHYNNLYYALPLLKKHKFKALINIIGQFSNFSSTSGDHSNLEYSHLTWWQINELYESGLFEIGNHSYNMHNYKPRFGVMQKKDETFEEYRSCLKGDIEKLQDKILLCSGVLPKVFAWPFGEYNINAMEILLSLGFEMFLTCNEGVSYIEKNNPSSILQLKRINRSGFFSIQELISKIDS